MENKPTEPKKEEAAVAPQVPVTTTAAPVATPTATPVPTATETTKSTAKTEVPLTTAEAKPAATDESGKTPTPGQPEKPPVAGRLSPGEGKDGRDDSGVHGQKGAGLGKTAIDFSFYKVRKSLSTALNKSPRARTYTVVILTLVTVIFFVAFTIIPTVSTIGSIRSEISRKEDIFASLKTNVSTIEALELQELANPEDFEAVHAAAPEKFEHNEFSKAVQELAVESGLTFGSVRFTVNISNQIEGLGDEFRATEVAVIVRGDTKNFVDFLAKVENLNRLYTVTSIDYAANPESTTSNQEYIVVGNVYNVRTAADWAALELAHIQD